jgi:hypothetical protein
MDGMIHDHDYDSCATSPTGLSLCQGKLVLSGVDPGLYSPDLRRPGGI